MIMLCRMACVGGEVINYKFGPNHDFNNQQKVRVDLFLDIIEGRQQKPDANIIISHLRDDSDKQGVHKQSEEFRWFNINGKPDYLLIDNYSELVDKKITHKEGWSFCAEYGDLKPEFFDDGTFVDNGLLPIDKIYESYDLFFTYIKNKWNIPIIFIHFSTALDIREKYINQGKAITEVLEKLSPKYNIQNIHADLNSIERKDGDCYHFGEKTIKNMADKIII